VKSQEALVASMTRHKLLTLKVKKKNRKEREEQFMAERSARCPEWMNPARGCEQREEELIRAQALEELPENCRSAFLLVRDEGATRREVARRLGISFGLVVNHVARAERHLADRLINVRPWNATPPTLLKQSWRDAHRPRMQREPLPGESLETPDRGGPS
jgi:RNA polymerase sigma-70 factor (ECF subfamily)